MNKVKVKSYSFFAIFSVFVLFVYNRTFISALFTSEMSTQSKFLSLLLVYSTLYFLHSFFFAKKTYKFFVWFFCFLNCVAMYFMDTYHALISKDAIINLLETNKNEAINFINLRLIVYFFLFFVLVLVFFTKIIYVEFSNFRKEAKYKFYLLIVFISSVFVTLSSKNLFYEIRQNKFLGDYIVPINYVRNIYRVVKMKIYEKSSKEFNIITNNFGKPENFFNDKKNLVVIVVGESARAKNWGLNGYERNTSEFLDKHRDNIVNFTNVESCGSSTFVSVPCIFSHMSSSNFSLNRAKNTENILDIFKNFGFDVFWLSNNGDCKNVCNRVYFKHVESANNFDDKLFEDAKVIVENGNNKNTILVLHQRGSHGPLYYKQYPENFDKYQPSCKSDIKDCDIQEVINSYDNSILYTSYLLSEFIDFLGQQKNYDNILLLYVSDHGESFGEKNMLMHAGPYVLTKNEQWKVPMFMWFQGYTFDRRYLLKASGRKLSHDNIFHSLLGLFGIYGNYYNCELDLFNWCKDAKY